MEHYDAGDCTPESPVSDTDTPATAEQMGHYLTDRSLKRHAAAAIAALESYQLVASAAEKTSTGMASQTYAYIRQRAAGFVQGIERIEATRIDPERVPPTRMPDQFLTDEELERWR